MYKFLILVALLPLSMAITPTQCPNGGPLPTSVTVAGCAQTPCTIVNGGDLSFSIDFVAPTGANTLTNVVNAFVLGIDTGYELPPEALDACNTVGCPVAGGATITYGMDVVVEAPITGVTATIQYQMLNENNEIMVCFRANANIQ